MGKSTISMAIFNSFLLVHQRVNVKTVPNGDTLIFVFGQRNISHMAIRSIPTATICQLFRCSPEPPSHRYIYICLCTALEHRELNRDRDFLNKHRNFFKSLRGGPVVSRSNFSIGQLLSLGPWVPRLFNYCKWYPAILMNSLLFFINIPGDVWYRYCYSMG